MVVEESLLEYPGIGPNKALQNLPLSRELPEKSSKKEAFVQATFRIGWLEGQLELTRKMLTEGAEATKQREEALLQERTLAEHKIQELKDQIANLQTFLQKATRRFWWEFWKPKPESLKTSLACG